MNYFITKRWNGVSLKNYDIKGRDISLIEVNHKYYFIVKRKAPNEDINGNKDYAYLFDRKINEASLEAIKASEDYYNVLPIIYNRTPDWIIKEIFCECGADKAYGLNNSCHSTWCPKYLK